VSDNTTSPPLADPAIPPPALHRRDGYIAHAPITPERRKKFLAALAETGSWRYASATASAHLVRAKGGFRATERYGEESFRCLMKRDPAFAAEVQEALNAATARLEKKLIDRIDVPNRRPIYDKNGGLLGHDENWRDANVLLLRALEKCAPDEWTPAQKRSVTSNVTVTHEGGAPAGLSYHVTAQDVLRLPPDEQRVLLALLERIEASREDEAAPALPAPAAVPALPPGQETANG